MRFYIVDDNIAVIKVLENIIRTRELGQTIGTSTDPEQAVREIIHLQRERFEQLPHAHIREIADRRRVVEIENGIRIGIAAVALNVRIKARANGRLPSAGLQRRICGNRTEHAGDYGKKSSHLNIHIIDLSVWPTSHIL